MQQQTRLQHVAGLILGIEIELRLASGFERAFHRRQLGDETPSERIDDLAVEQIHRLAEDLLHARDVLLVIGGHVRDEENRLPLFSLRRTRDDRTFLEVRREFGRHRIRLLDHLDERARVFDALERILEQAGADDREHVLVDVGVRAARRDRLRLDDQARDVGRVLAGERQLAGGGFEEHDAGREDIGALVDRQRRDLLRRHVRDRARIAALLLIDQRGFLAAHEIREIQSREPHLSLVRDQHRVAVDVAVQQHLRVQVLHDRRELMREAEKLRALERLAVQDLRERRALDELQDHDQRVADRLDLEDRNEERVIQRGGHTHIANQRLAPPGILRQRAREQFQRDVFPVARVFRDPNRRADTFTDTPGTEGLIRGHKGKDIIDGGWRMADGGWRALPDGAPSAGWRLR